MFVRLLLLLLLLLLLQVPHAGVQRFPGPPATSQSLHPQTASQGHYPPPKPAFWNPVAKGNVPWQPQTAERKSLAPHEFQARPVRASRLHTVVQPWYRPSELRTGLA